MTSQKLPLPLLGGQIYPLHNAQAPGTPQTIFVPPDAVLDEPPSTYEVHLWLMPPLGYGGATAWTIDVQARDLDTNTAVKIWSGLITPAASAHWPTRKVLDGFPMRGNISIEVVPATVGADADAYPSKGVQVFGYFYRVGQGPVLQTERRFIGQNLPEFKKGLPFSIPATTKQVIHTFEAGRIDEISLAFSSLGTGPGAIAALVFEDAAGNPIIPLHGINVPATSVQNLDAAEADAPEGFQPNSQYQIHQVPFGGINPNLKRISVQAGDTDITVHGYFTRH